ncbi:MAG: NAD-dependent epimerase/dehydratase family protein [Pseudomonadota bacterium]
MAQQNHSVTLGAGPMGRAIAQNLAASGESVTVVTRDGRTVGAGTGTAKADLSNAEQTIAACAGADVIYFCAAPPYHKWEVGFPALQEAALAAAEATGAVLVAVENLYGYGVAGTLTEDMALNATTRKGALRARLSRELLATHASGRVKCVAGRATDFFGPGVRISALGERFWPALLSGKPVDWVGDPDAPHSFAYLPDLAAACVTLAKTPSAWGRAWHFPALRPVSVREICEMAKPGGDTPTKIRATPSWLLRLVGLFQPAAGELVEMRYMFDNSFVIDHSPFDQAFGADDQDWGLPLKETLAWWGAQAQKQTT